MLHVRDSRIAKAEAAVLLGALESISRMLHGSWDNACTAMGIADKALAGWRGIEKPPVSIDGGARPDPLNEFDKEEWWDVVSTCRPEITRDGFELMWNKFQALKRKKAAQ
jgi:hypothetical protein